MNATAQLESQSVTGTQMEEHLDYTNQYVSFWIDGQLLGIPVNTVQEVLTAQSIARTPKSRPEIAGLLNLRGQIVTAVNLRKRLGLPDLGEDRESKNVVIRSGGESFSLLVDEVGDVINISSAKIEAVPHTLDTHWKSVTSGVVRLDEKLFIILNVSATLKFN